MAVRPGMEGGHYKPLSERDVERIHDAALHVLERIGVGAVAKDAPTLGKLVGRARQVIGVVGFRLRWEGQQQRDERKQSRG